MAKFATIAQLVAAKKRLGPVIFLDYKALDFVTAHRKLGEEVKWQVHKILSRKLEQLSQEELVEQISLVRQCRLALEGKLLSSRIDSGIRDALREYLASLSAWSEGVELASFQYHYLHNLVIDDKPISSDDLALLLQNDNSGCQTGVYRDKDGFVILWHTEEDVEEEPGSRFDKPRVASFRVEENNRIAEINAFVYPDLLPGPAYCWRSDNFVQAVDALYLKPKTQNNGIFANVATWITWRLGKKTEPKKVIETLGPFIDSYAITIVQEKNEQVFANKFEFAGDQIFTTSLENNPGSFLFQVNVFSKKDESIALEYEEDLDLNTRKLFEERIARTERAIKRIRTSNGALYCLPRLLSSRLGGDYAYANEDVKSYFIGRVSNKGMEIWIGAGPALLEDNPKVITTG